MTHSIQTARGCAWRALYYTGTSGGEKRVTAHVGIDPDPTRPTLFLGLSTSPRGDRSTRRGGNRTSGRSHSLRLRLPTIPWRWVMASGYHPVVLAAYQATQRLWHGLDGRYGWGTASRRAR